MKRFWLFTALTSVLVLAACSNTSGPTPTLTVSPTSKTVTAGGAPVSFTATLKGSSDTVQWSLSPTSSAGSISPASGATTTYTPPASASSKITVTLTASAGTLSAQATITVNPASAPGPGTLDVIINAPAGVTPSVTVTGPGGYSKALTATTTLKGLTPGSYTATPKRVENAGPVVGQAYSAPAKTVSVAASGNASVTIDYGLEPGSGKIWTATDFVEPSIFGYDAAGLGTSQDNLSANAVLGNTSAVGSPEGIAFDAAGNLWVASEGAGQLVEYGLSQLGSSDATVAPALVLQSSDLSGPWGLAFDAQGGLWVSNYLAGTVVHFPAAALHASGTTTATAATADLTLTGFYNPVGLAFDAAGNLWVADSSSSSNTIFGFTPADLAAQSGPSYTLTGGTVGTPEGPRALAFDADGNLWVSATNLYRYPASSLTNASAKPDLELSPTLTSKGQVSTVLGALAFDASGNLWIAMRFSVNGYLLMYKSSSLHGGLNQSQDPDLYITGPELKDRSNGDITLPWGLAFDPAAAGLPLVH